MILGIDLGQKTTGVAIAEEKLALPYTTIKHLTVKEAASKIAQLSDQLQATKAVIGFVEGKIKTIFEKFASDLQRLRPNLEVVLWDETLTSRQAVATMIKLGIAKKKRIKKENEVAAAIILQSFLDSHD